MTSVAECLLFPKADVRASQKPLKLGAANGQKQPLQDLARHSELDTTAKRRKMAIELGDMTKLQWFGQCRSLLSWRD